MLVLTRQAADNQSPRQFAKAYAIEVAETVSI